MEVEHKSKSQLIAELEKMRRQVAELKKLEGELKQVEVALRESEERWRSLAQNAPDTIMTLNRDGTILFVNRTFPWMTRDQVMGKTVYDFVAPEYHESFRESLERTFRTGETTTYESRGLDEWDPSWYSNRLGAVKRGGEVVAVTMIATNIEEHKRAEKALRDLSRRLVEVQEIERRHISRELHDDVGQALTGLKLLLAEVTRTPAENLDLVLGEAQTLIDELMARVGDLSIELRPPMLDDLGILPALSRFFKIYTARTRVRVKFDHRGLKKRLAPEVETTVYRIVQETLTNVARHAKVELAAVRVTAHQHTLRVQIEDHGAGFNPEEVLSTGASSGIVGMRERAIALGGQLAVNSAPGCGTRVVAELPLKGAAIKKRKDRLP